MCKMRTFTPPKTQSGVVLVLTTVAMVALLGMAGLALDMGDVYVNKTRLQNALDASALSAAKELVVTAGDMAAATAVARNTFALNKDEGNEALAAIPNESVNVEFSANLVPWIPNSGASFVRVWVDIGSFTRPSFLIQVLGIDSKPVAASATAGPEQASCSNLFPMLACGDAAAHDPSNNNYWGYTPGDQVILKIHAGGCPEPATPDNPDPCNGPGNFNVLDVGSGAAAVREALCGKGEHACAGAGHVADTEPGNMVGPVGQGLNTMFNVHQGGVKNDECPADTNITEYIPPDDTPPFFNAAHYLNASNPGNGRRVVPVPVGTCTEVGGKKEVQILDTLCFLITRKAEQSGSTQYVYGEFLDPALDCLTSGKSNPDPTATGGPVIIVLYKDPVARDG